MRGLGVACRRPRKLKGLDRRGEGRGRRMDRQMRAVDAAELLRARMHVDEGRLRPRNVEQRVTLRRQLAEPPADDDDEVGGSDAREEFWIGTNAEVACVARMQLIEQIAAAERR